MSIHKPITVTGLYFITFTCQQWMPLIEVVKGYDLVYKWFDTLSSNGHSICGYVIMPNHIHLLLHFVWSGKSLNTVVSNGKRFMAYGIVERLHIQDELDFITKLKQAVKPSDVRRGKKHAVWIDSFDVKVCKTEGFILQKLNYIHTNPCAGKWKLAEDPTCYKHSSASFYISGKKSTYPVKDYRRFLYASDE